MRAVGGTVSPWASPLRMGLWDREWASSPPRSILANPLPPHPNSRDSTDLRAQPVCPVASPSQAPPPWAPGLVPQELLQGRHFAHSLRPPLSCPLLGAASCLGSPLMHSPPGHHFVFSPKPALSAAFSVQPAPSAFTLRPPFALQGPHTRLPRLSPPRDVRFPLGLPAQGWLPETQSPGLCPVPLQPCPVGRGNTPSPQPRSCIMLAVRICPGVASWSAPLGCRSALSVTSRVLPSPRPGGGSWGQLCPSESLSLVQAWHIGGASEEQLE